MQQQVQQVVFSNVPLYGGGLAMNPAASPTDGLLDIAVFPWKGYVHRPLQFFPLFSDSRLGRFFDPLRIRSHQASVEGEGGLPAHVDGEPCIVENPVASVRPGALWVLQVGPPVGRGAGRRPVR
jgi:diacylglycerol kinase family enzyme